MLVGELCRRDVDCARPDESVAVAVQRMTQRSVGSLVVTSSDGRPLGIVTDRDLLTRGLSQRVPLETILLKNVMTTPISTVGQNSAIEEAMKQLRDTHCRRLPVVDDDGKLTGIIALDDLVLDLGRKFQWIVEVLHRESPTLSMPMEFPC